MVLAGVCKEVKFAYILSIKLYRGNRTTKINVSTLRRSLPNPELVESGVNLKIRRELLAVIQQTKNW
jgi:hypothetical protein